MTYAEVAEHEENPLPGVGRAADDRRPEEARLAAARRVADAILFEGYILYPYRATSAKNQLRWQFGMLGPVGAAEAGVGEEPGMRATLLVEPEPKPDPEPEARPEPGGEVSVDLTLRFLHPQFRSVEQATAEGFEPVDALTVAGARWVPWHEAVVCEVPLPSVSASDVVIPIEIAAAVETEMLHDDNRCAGRLVRTRERLRGQVRVSWRPLDAGRPLMAVEVDVVNLGRWDHSRADGTSRTAARDLAARASFAGAHLVARARGVYGHP